MKKREGYRMRVAASYLDYRPIIFDIKVKYLHNIDGIFKVLDLGTHIFFKND
jgi:hypothetical protein